MDFRSFLAPIDSYTNLPFRMMCQRYGAESCCVPLISAYTLTRERKKIAMVDTHKDERNVGVQLVGKDPVALGIAAKGICDSRAISYLNLNCGCPSAHTMESGGGSALLSSPDIIVRSLEEMRENSPSSILISMKMRIKDNQDSTLAICKSIAKAGADFIILHGRTPKQGYSGKADWELIKNVKDGCDVPIIGNGDLMNASEGSMRIEGGYCDGFMIGRAAMANPMCFKDMEPEGLEGKFDLLDEYLSFSERYLGGLIVKDLKLKAMNILTGVPGACAMRNTIAKAKTVEEILALRKH